MIVRVRAMVAIATVFLVFSGLLSTAVAETKKITVMPGEIELANSLRQRETAVAARERELTSREELVRELETEVEARLSQLTELQKDIQEKLTEIKEVEDSNFRSLVRVYSSMKPSSAALILNQMEDAAAVRILRAMKTEVTAQIMPRLDGKKAVRISRQLGMID